MVPVSVVPASAAPASVAPATVIPVSMAPASVVPVSVAPVSVAPVSVIPSVESFHPVMFKYYLSSHVLFYLKYPKSDLICYINSLWEMGIFNVKWIDSLVKFIASYLGKGLVLMASCKRQLTPLYNLLI